MGTHGDNHLAMPKSPFLGHGHFLSPGQCRAIVGWIRRKAWWQHSEIGEEGDSGVDLSACRSTWCWLEGPLRKIVMTRVAEISFALAARSHPPRFETPVIMRYREGGFFLRHSDEYKDPENAARRRMSLVAFLTGHGEKDGFTGGELRFYAAERCVRFAGVIGRFVVFSPEVEH